MSRNGNWLFGRHFVIVYPIFDFFFLLYFGFFWITLSVARILPPNSFVKYFSELGSIETPLTTIGSTLYLDHLSVK